jgi:phosphatidate cytidylyltransferase
MPVREGGPSLTASMSITVLGIFWIGLAVAHAVLLRDLPHGGGLLVAVLLGTFIGDTGAYLGGRLLGSRRLAPRISPNKTWEGLAIGFVVAVFVVWWYGLGSEWMGGQRGVLLGITVAIAAPLGDLFESKVKRDAGTKDAGSLFGPHGGALDRLDAALFSLVAAYYVWLALA